MIPTLAVERRPLRVNAVSPGVIATPWWDRVPEDFRHDFFAQAATSAPVGRIGQPEDVAHATLPHPKHLHDGQHHRLRWWHSPVLSQ